MTAAIRIPCVVCGEPVYAVTAGLCQRCEKDSDFYRRSRKKGDKRQFIPYPELFDQWKRRRAECATWRKTAEQAERDRKARHAAEIDLAAAMTVLERLGDDLNLTLKLAAENNRLRAELEQATHNVEDLRSRLMKNLERELAGWKRPTYDDETNIPIEQWRRLVQLAHPDKHNGSESAKHATAWLLENRP